MEIASFTGLSKGGFQKMSVSDVGVLPVSWWWDVWYLWAEGTTLCGTQKISSTLRFIFIAAVEKRPEVDPLWERCTRVPNKASILYMELQASVAIVGDGFDKE